MLARSTTVRHPSGIEIRTPLLIPSFSSKGFGFTANKKSEAGPLLGLAAEQLTDSVLISAYDLHHKHVVIPRTAVPNVTIVDSGGYETTDFQDLSTTFVQPLQKLPWTEANLKAVYDKWSKNVPAVFVGFDRRGSVAKQVAKSHALLKKYPDQLHTILVKPNTAKARFIQMSDVLANIASFAHFHFVGFTEKELGSSSLQRMVNISKIRLALDEADLRQVPIHVFGSLDPITVPLYFIAGAEVFDGLTWLRFGYHDGSAMYIQNSAARGSQLHHSDDQVKLLNLRQNLGAMSLLTNQMRRFLNASDFSMLAPNDALLRNAFELLKNENPRAA